MNNPFDKKPRKLRFKTSRQQNKNRSVKLTAVFITAVVVIALVSITLLLREYDYDLSNMFKSKNTESKTDTSVTTTAVPSALSKKFTVVFAGVSTGESEVFFVSEIEVNTVKKSFTVTDYSPSQFNNVYVSDGGAGIKKKLATVTGDKIDRYVVITEKKFKTFISYLGGFDVSIPEPIDYNGSDFSLNMLKGSYSITGDKLFKYIRYKAVSGTDDAYSSQAQVICDLLSQSLSVSNVSKGDTLFNELINTSKSDISIIDYTQYQTFLSDAASDGFTVKAG